MDNEPKFKSVSLKTNLYKELEEIAQDIMRETGLGTIKIPDVINKLTVEYRKQHAKV
jgi:hypothetical protein